MGDTGNDKMALQIKGEADDLTQKWSHFAQKCVDAAARGDAFCSEHVSDVVGMLNKTGRVLREKNEALDQLEKAQERQREMESKIRDLEQALQECRTALAVAQVDKADTTKAPKTIDEVFESQQGNQAVLVSRLHTIATDLKAMKEALDKQSPDHLEALTGGSGVSDKADRDENSSHEDDYSADEIQDRPNKRKRTDEDAPRDNGLAELPELSEDERRKLDAFTALYSPVYSVLQRIVPWLGTGSWAETWDPKTVMAMLQEICSATTGATKNMESFVRGGKGHLSQWYCARTVALGYHHALLFGHHCPNCENRCLQLLPLGKNGRFLGYCRARIIRPRSQAGSLFGTQTYSTAQFSKASGQ